MSGLSQSPALQDMAPVWKEQSNCLPFPGNVSELFQGLCRECGGCMEAAVQLGCALVFCCQGEGGSLARFQKGMSTRWGLDDLLIQ